MTHDLERGCDGDRNRLLLTVSEVAGLLNMGRSTVYELIIKGDLPSVKIGRSRRILTTALDEFVAQLAG